MLVQSTADCNFIAVCFWPKMFSEINHSFCLSKGIYGVHVATTNVHNAVRELRPTAISYSARREVELFQ